MRPVRVYPPIVSTDLDDVRFMAGFGEDGWSAHANGHGRRWTVLRARALPVRPHRVAPVRACGRGGRSGADHAANQPRRASRSRRARPPIWRWRTREAKAYARATAAVRSGACVVSGASGW
jgi:hypothetical protein